jgi:hypothetical protein
LKKEVVELLSGIHLRTQLIHIYCLEVHKFYKITKICFVKNPKDHTDKREEGMIGMIGMILK